MGGLKPGADAREKARYDAFVTSGVKLKKVRVLGYPNAPGYWYEYEDEAEVLMAEPWNKAYIIEALKQMTEAPPQDDYHHAVWYGVVLDTDPVVNEFGTVTP